MTERIGSDVLGAQERAERQMEEKRKKEMMQKLQEERAKKKMSDDLDGKQIPSSEIPGNHAHERKCGEGADLDIHSRQVRVRVKAHSRGNPKRGAKTE